MAQEIAVIRIDPAKRIITRMTRRFSRNATRDFREIMRATKEERIGFHKLLDIEEVRLTHKAPHPTLRGLTVDIDLGPTPLHAAGKLEVDEAVPGWRLRGCEDHAGVGLLYGVGEHKGIVNVPVNVDWIEQRIVWIDGEDATALRERAAVLLPLLAPEIRAALLSAVEQDPLSAQNSMWLPATCAELFPSMIRLGLGHEATQGQRLTKLGVATRELLEMGDV